MAEADDPTWNAAMDRLAHWIADSVAAVVPSLAAAAASTPVHSEESQATPILTEDGLFDVVFPKEKLHPQPAAD